MRMILFGIALFFSGWATLCYELIWVGRLGDMLGHSAYAINIILSVFFFGLGAGGFVIGRLADRTRGSIAVFVGVELGMAAYAVAFDPLLSLADALYLYFASPETTSASGLWVKGAMSAALLAVPTFLMGGSLPAAARHCIRGGQRIAGRIGWLYGINTIGAALGVLMTIFLVLPHFGLSVGLWCAICANLLASGTAWLARYPAAQNEADEKDAVPSSPAESVGGRGLPVVILIAAFAAGAVSIAYEVLWTRALASRFFGSVYSYAIILLVYLLCLGGGSLLVALLDRLKMVHRRTVAVLPMVAGLAGLLSVVMIGRIPLLADKFQTGADRTFGSVTLMELGYCLAIMAVPIALFGMNLPILIRLGLRRTTRLGGSIGGIFFANSVGSVLSPLVIGFWLMPLLGVRNVLLLAASAAVLFGALVLWPWAVASAKWRVTGIVVCVGLGAALVMSLPKDIRLWRDLQYPDLVEYREGVTASVAVLENEVGSRIIQINSDYRFGGAAGRYAQYRQALMPLALHPAAMSSLFIGMGTGGTAGAATQVRELAVDALEISPGVVQMLRHFDDDNFNLRERAASDDRVRVLCVDARQFLRTTRQRYDVVVADLFNPRQDKVGMLYSREHFLDIKRCLRGGGLFCQWVPVYRLPADQLRSVMATFCGVFEHWQMWWLDHDSRSCVVGLVGFAQAPQVDIDYVDLLLSERVDPKLAGSVDLDDSARLLSHYICSGEALARFLHDVPINTLDHPRVEYWAPRQWLTDDARWVGRNLGMLQAFTQSLAGQSWLVGTASKIDRAATRQEAMRHLMAAAVAVRRDADPQRAIVEYRRSLELAGDFMQTAGELDRLASAALQARRVEDVSAAAAALLCSTTHAYLGYYYMAAASPDRAAAVSSLDKCLTLNPSYEPGRVLQERLQRE